MSDKVLIIDNNMQTAQSIKDHLENVGLDIKVFKGIEASEAVNAAKDFKPDVILLDVINSEEHGFQILKDLKKDPETSMVPVILDSILENTKDAGLKLGAVDFVGKPIDMGALYNSVENVLNKKAGAHFEAVLVIDDDEATVNMTCDYLESKDIRCLGATSGAEGLRIMQQKAIGLILLDLMMPGMDGYSVIRIVKDNPLTCEIPIIIMTGVDIKECRDKCIMLGAEECFTKPFTGQHLLKEVNSFLKQSDRRKAAAPEKHGAKVLIADDEEIIRELIKDTLEQDGYELIIAKDGREALEKIYSDRPDILLIDLNMPYMNGFEVVEKVREDVLMRNLPIIMLTAAKGGEKDELRGLEIGVDEYLTKPFRPAILSARVRAAFLRIQQGLDVNPLTYLPGNTSISREIERRLRSKTNFAALYVDIDRFKAYNDYYGFHKGDEIIKYTARILVDAVSEINREGSFVGHIGGDDYICIIDEDKIDVVCEEIIERFEEGMVTYYEKEDFDKGSIVIENRKGEVETFALIALSIGVVTTKNRNFTHIGQIAKIGAELKKYAKKNEKSNFVLDRRID